MPKMLITSAVKFCYDVDNIICINKQALRKWLSFLRCTCMHFYEKCDNNIHSQLFDFRLDQDRKQIFFVLKHVRVNLLYEVQIKSE